MKLETAEDVSPDLGDTELRQFHTALTKIDRVCGQGGVIRELKKRYRQGSGISTIVSC